MYLHLYFQGMLLLPKEKEMCKPTYLRDRMSRQFNFKHLMCLVNVIFDNLRDCYN